MRWAPKIGAGAEGGGGGARGAGVEGVTDERAWVEVWGWEALRAASASASDR